MKRLFSIFVLLIFKIIHLNNAEPTSPRWLLSNPDILPPNSAEFPFLVSIQLNRQHLCAGTLISSTHIVTAAHCVHGLIVKRELNLAKQLVILAGFAGGKSFEQKRHVRRLSMHPDYKHDDKTFIYLHDVAVITVREPFTESKYVEMISPFENVTLSKDKELVASCFGSSVYDNQVIPYVLKSNLRIVNRTECLKQFPGKSVSVSIFCAKETEGFNSCMGDRGGPVIVDNNFVGVFSCSNGLVDTFTLLFKHGRYIARERTYRFLELKNMNTPYAFNLDTLIQGEVKNNSRQFFYPWEPRPFLSRPPKIFYYLGREEQSNAVKLVFLDQPGYSDPVSLSLIHEQLIPVNLATKYVFSE